MDRLSMGERIAGASAVLLFVFMFFSWFNFEGGGVIEGATGSENAWNTLDNIPVFLMIVIVFTLIVVALRLSESDFEPAVPLGAVVAVLGAISVLLILYRIIDPPGEADVPGLSIDVSPAFGIFLSLVAAGGIAYGGYRAMDEEGASFGGTADRLSGGPPTDSGTGTGAPPPPPPR